MASIDLHSPPSPQTQTTRGPSARARHREREVADAGLHRPPYFGDSVDQSVRQSIAKPVSARPGCTISDRAVVLVDLPELAKAPAVFGKAGMRAVLDSDKFGQPGLYGRDQ